MTTNEFSHGSHSEQWTQEDAYQLYKYMDSTRPTFQTRKSRDPIVLAQEFQHTIDSATDSAVRRIMGSAGEETLNQIAPNQITYRHLAIVTDRLIVLSAPTGRVIGDYATKTLVTGLFDRFAFEDAEHQDHVDSDWIAVKLTKPSFLYAESREIALELFDADKELVAVAADNELTIPVAAVRGQVYDPETLFH